MAFTLTVSSRTVNPDSSIQYQFADGSGLIFADATMESDYCDQTDIEILIARQVQRLLVGKTISKGSSGASATFDANETNGYVLRLTNV